jgi:hypothetical protein
LAFRSRSTGAEVSDIRMKDTMENAPATIATNQKFLFEKV